MDKLSPSAQAVLDATANAYFDWDDGGPAADMAAAALRAAAYQVAPARPMLDSCCEHYEQAIRDKLFAIADELEAQSSIPLQ